ncbi:DoxX family protein [Chryseosolibacter indicus]|uniref:DoxX family protein n=1 Tax=Chryseosolibacter indicus TaxID=2782351 RepID=A0ABS5VQG4_9BACT|nr:DoxX family protein [Chryseosolibacter indicus]MBT1703692.1 DoxX family protein [Chryseosolibacter indicus]
MKNKILNYQSLNTDVAVLLLRILVGSLFTYYGYSKLLAFEQIVPMFKNYTGLGVKASLVLAIIGELGGGILILIGLLTRFAATMIFITMCVAYFVAHANDPFDVKQLAFVYLILSVVIFILGSGRLSVARLITGKK